MNEAERRGANVPDFSLLSSTSGLSMRPIPQFGLFLKNFLHLHREWRACSSCPVASTDTISVCSMGVCLRIALLLFDWLDDNGCDLTAADTRCKRVAYMKGT